MEIPDGSGFGLDNLPYGVFSTGSGTPRVGVRAGDNVIDLAALLGGEVFATPSLNAFMAQGPARWASVRAEIQSRLAGDVPAPAVHPVESVTLHLPWEVADYVDFYASEHHASNVGRIIRPGAPPLTPNWKHLPIGYHGRAGTVVVSGTDVVRPRGQRRPPGDGASAFGPSELLDFEAELGFVVGAGSPMGTPVAADDFASHVFGVVLLNDWSARDIQAWESVPLGPHLGKSFATSVSPWVVPMPALAAARVPLPAQDPGPLPYLRASEPWGLDISLAVAWNGEEVSRPPYRTMYWSPAQMLAHMTANGASSRTGDLFASGTISGPERLQRGCLLELTWLGAEPLTVKGEQRTFLDDGDEVTITATAPGTAGSRIALGEVAGRILPARPATPELRGPGRRPGQGLPAGRRLRWLWLAERPGSGVEEPHQQDPDRGGAERPAGMLADVGKVKQHRRDDEGRPARGEVGNRPVAEPARIPSLGNAPREVRIAVGGHHAAQEAEENRLPHPGRLLGIVMNCH
jgi:fumarylacetoacetase